MKCKALRCIYYNEGNGYTVASYVTEEALPEKVSTQKNSQYGVFTAVGNELPTEDGLEVELNGTWKDGKFGMQYKVSSFQVVLPTNTKGIKAYLASDFIKGIGPVLAERIVDHYKEKTFEILEKDPGRLLEIKGITKKKLMEILEGYQNSETLRQLMVALSPFGVTPRKVAQIQEHFGNAAPLIIQDTPFRLCEIPGFGFLTVDPIAVKAKNFKPDEPMRIKAAILHVMSEAEGEGHLYLSCEQVLTRTGRLLNHKGADGQVTGGPVYYIRAAFKGTFGKVLAALFAILITLALGFMGNAVQSNSIAAAFHTAFGIPQWIMGVVVAVIALFVFAGGIERIAKVTETIVPLMAALYIVGALIVIIYNYKNIPYAFASIFVGAFAPQSVVGGAAGATVKLALTKGVARGLFSNEAGMGSTPHAHAVAKVNHPVEQGFVAMAGVFIDTFIVLNLTALVILTTKSIPSGKTGAELSQYAFSTLYGKGGNVFIAICMFFFAFSTIIGWYFFGQANIKYLFGPKAVKIYSVLAACCVFLGSLAEVDLVWNMADCFNSLMVIPNILALFALSKVISQVHKDYFTNFNKAK